jgi:methyl-accepting chemotaxis protein-2 (aspartate sensor receptor)
MFSSVLRGVRNLRIATKLYLGFGFVLVMLLLVAGAGTLSMKGIAVQSEKTVVAADIQDTLDAAEMARMRYLATSGSRYIDENEKNLSAVEQRIAAARPMAWDAEGMATLDAVGTGLTAYRASRVEMLERQADRLQARKNWSATAEKLEGDFQKLTARLETAVANYSMEYGAELSQFAVMVADLEKRYAAARYQLRGMVIDESAESEKEVLTALDSLQNRAKAIGMQLPDSDQDLVAPILSDLQAYRGMVASYMPAVMQERAANRIMEDTAARLNTATKNLFDREIARIDTLSQSAWRATSIFAAIALALGIVAAWTIARQITRPLAQTVAVAEKIAQGDLTGEFESDRHDETGQLLRAMRTMQDFLARTVAAVRQGVDEINGGAREIASGNADLSSRSEEQAAALEETAASMEELASTVKNNAENAHQASTLASTASTVATRGGHAVQEVVATMDGISESSRQIAEIIGVIESIAFQTNILALNAAVEAARAGEQGKGFAVVASEVRSLAQRSAGAAKEIKELIGESVDRVTAGSRQVQDTARTMEEIVDAVRRATDIMHEISEASREQAGGIEQVSQAVGQMDATTQQNAALVEQAAAASASLESQAGSLAQAVAIFKLRAGEIIDVGAAAIRDGRGMTPARLQDA